MITLPCVTLRAPYAALVCGGLKAIETRTGPVLSGFSGPLLIAASKGPPLPFDPSVWGVDVPGFPGLPGTPAGCVIGVVWVTETRSPGEIAAVLARHPSDLAVLTRAALHPVEGRYLSTLSRAAWLTRPIPVRGLPGRYPVTVPAEVLPEWARGAA